MANVVPSSPILVTLMMEALSSSETSVMADMVRCKENNLNLLPDQIHNRSDIDCEKCNILENRLLIVQKELKTSRLIIELLLEDVDSPGKKDPGAERDNIQGLQIPLKDINWLHVQDNPHKKKTPEQKHLSEIYLKTENRFAALSNLTNSTGQSEIKKCPVKKYR
jgi:hypothetical protein